MRFYLISLLIHGIILLIPWSCWNHEESALPLSNKISIDVSSFEHSLPAEAVNAQNHSAMDSKMVEAEKVQKNTKSSFAPNDFTKQHTNVPVERGKSVSSTLTEVPQPSRSDGYDTSVAGQQSNDVNGGADDSATTGSGLAGENFVSNGDGTYTALSPSGIDYHILHSVEANYPEEARAVGYVRTICVEAAILVGLDGNVESVTILNDVPNLGFRDAARQALMQWRFSPIYYQGINIKMKFYKNIYFEPA